MNATETAVIAGYYVFWMLILIAPVVIGITAYFFFKKKGTLKTRRLLLIASIFLSVLTIFQIVGSAQRKKMVEEMPQEKIYE